LDSQAVRALAARAYLAACDKAATEAILENLASADYLLASEIEPPTSSAAEYATRVVSRSAALDAAIVSDEAVVSRLIDEIRRATPVKYLDCEKKRTHQYSIPSYPSIRRVSLVSSDGASGVGA
jgi:hypothetical protein